MFHSLHFHIELPIAFCLLFTFALSFVYCLCTAFGYRPYFLWAQIQMTHEQYLALGLLSLVASFGQPMDASPSFMNPMYDRTVRTDHGLNAVTAQHIGSALGNIVADHHLASNLSSNVLAPVPKAKFILVRNNQNRPHPHEWCQR